MPRCVIPTKIITSHRCRNILRIYLITTGIAYTFLIILLLPASACAAPNSHHHSSSSSSSSRYHSFNYYYVHMFGLVPSSDHTKEEQFNCYNNTTNQLKDDADKHDEQVVTTHNNISDSGDNIIDNNNEDRLLQQSASPSTDVSDSSSNGNSDSAVHVHNKNRSTSSSDTIIKPSLREKIRALAIDFELNDESSDRANANNNNPVKLLRTLAPKIPAIKRAPDFTLRITGASSEEACAAAYAIYLVAQKAFAAPSSKVPRVDVDDALSEEYGDANVDDDNEYHDLIHDRRFQQLVECAMCGMDVELAMKLVEEDEAKLAASNDSSGTTSNMDEEDVSVLGKREEGDEVETLSQSNLSKSDYDSELEAKEYPIKEGLSVIDASLLAWSLALLGIDDLPTLGNEDPKMVLSALANRCKRMLKSRKDSLFSENIDTVELNDFENNKMEKAEFLAKDAASVCWAFACVKGCTNVRSDGLFSTCCDILYSPLDDLYGAVESVDQLVDRLSKSSESNNENVDDSAITHTSAEANEQDIQSNECIKSEVKHIDRLAHFLSLNGVIDVIWACAIHGHPKSDLRKLVEVMRPIILNEVKGIAYSKSELLYNDQSEKVKHHKNKYNNDAHICTIDEGATEKEAPIIPSTEDLNETVPEVIIVSEDDLISEEGLVEVVDAATLIAAENQANLQSESGDSISPDIQFNEPDNEHIDIEIDDAVASQDNPLLSFTITPRDMCSLIWAFTEVGVDSNEIIRHILSSLNMAGSVAFSEMEGRDLSNLVWSIARCSGNLVDVVPHSIISNVLDQAGEWLLLRLGSQLSKLDQYPDKESNNLDPISPTDLSRALWSFALCFDKEYITQDERGCSLVGRLALEGLHLASSYLNYFTAEDLVSLK